VVERERVTERERERERARERERERDRERERESGECLPRNMMLHVTPDMLCPVESPKKCAI
jgi:hypothetical protein